MKNNNTAKLFGVGLLLVSTSSMALLTAPEVKIIGPGEVSLETDSGLAFSNLLGGVPNSVPPAEFSQFDESLGALKGVFITVSGTVSGQLSVVNNGNSMIGITQLGVQSLFQFDLFNDDVIFSTESGFVNSLVGDAAGVTLPAGLASGGTLGGAVTTSVELTNVDVVADWGANLNDFIGNGIWEFGCSIDTAISVSVIGGSGEGSFGGTGQCNVSVVYRYGDDATTGDNTTPLPGTAWLMLLIMLSSVAKRIRFKA